MKKFKLFNGFVLGLVCLLILAGCESKVLIATPVANAGPDQNVARSDLVNLDGSGSTDPNADPLTYLWTMDPVTGIPAGSAAALSSTTLVNPTFVADLDGTYTITLVVSDGATSSAVDTVVISVSNTAPVADAGAPQTQAKNTLVTLNGSGSFDANLLDILTYNWTFTSVPTIAGGDLEDSAVTDASLNDNNSTSAIGPTFTADAEGDYVLELQVTDGTAFSNVAIVVITITNTPPTAVVNVPASVHTGTIAILDGTGTSNPDVDGDTLATYTWAIDSRPGGAGIAAIVNSGNPSASLTPDAVGTYTISLVVNDGFDDSVPAVVTFDSINQVPSVVLGLDQSSHIGAIVQLDGSGATDGDNDVLSYLWTASAAGGGTYSFNPPTADVQSPTITTGGTADTFTITLTVSDNFANSVTSSDSMLLTTSINVPPTADTSATVTTVTKSASVPVTLDGSASADSNGDTLTYVWTFVGVPAGSGVTDASLSDNNTTTAVNPTFTADFSGAYDLSLTVNDSEPLFSAPATVTINVSNDPPVADAGADLIVAIGTGAILDGIASSDPNGDALNYAWTFVSVPTTPVASSITDADLSPTNTSVAPTFDPDEIGDYTLRLVVTDNEGVSSLVADEVVVSGIIPVQDTGQTVASGNPGEDADFGSIYQPSYTDNGDGTTTDNWTGLIWQQPGDMQIDNWYGATGTYNDPDNLTTRDVCGALGLLGLPWRLPTREELASVINYGNTGPAVNGTYFPSVAAAGDQYWSSDSLAGGASEGWLVDLSSGILASDSMAVNYLIICVSGDPLPVGVLGDNGDGTVTDTTTALVWQQVDDALPKNWTAALAYCAGLDLPAGTGDWRLPNIRELASITDLTVVADPTTPSISQPPFASSASNHYWSSTYALNPVGNTWVVDFNGGDIVNLDVNSVKMSRCVRGGQ